MRSLMGGGHHRRNNSDGIALPAAPLLSTNPGFHLSQRDLAVDRAVGVSAYPVGFSYKEFEGMDPDRYAYTRALFNDMQNRQADRSPERRGRERDRERDGPSTATTTPSPIKNGFATISLKLSGFRDKSRDRDSGDPSRPPRSTRNNENSPKKAKSATNLAALLGRPKSMKNLKQFLVDDDNSGPSRPGKDRENRTPPTTSLGAAGDCVHAVPTPPTPIYMQYASQRTSDASSSADSHIVVSTNLRSSGGNSASGNDRPPAATPSLGRRPRPKSFQTYLTRREEPAFTAAESGDNHSDSNSSAGNRTRRMTWGRYNGPSPIPTPGAAPPATPSRPEMRPRSKSGLAPSGTPGSAAAEFFIDPKDIDKHLEAMLDRRNIPENQRYKMRNLSDTIKMEFIRQDWAEMQAALERPSSLDGAVLASGSDGGAGGAAAGGEGSSVGATEDGSPKKKKHGRGLSLTLVRGSGNKSNPTSPTKKHKRDSSLGRHFRTKSSESLVSDGALTPSGGAGSLPGYYGNGFLAKVKGQQLPGDFVAYLQRVQKPEEVEVGKLHKLRLLLRNETVAWTDEFVRLGGMREIVELLYRIMAVEWREEHEDALLHENLLCLKALCTTDLALQYLHEIHATLFPRLLRMIFDPEKKGPSEFTTRNIVTSLLFTYIETAPPLERISRAKAVLGFLRDPEPPENEKPVDFVLEMRRERPYRIWCKEVVSVTKEVFWIFLHNLNIVALPSADSRAGASSSDQANCNSAEDGSTSSDQNPDDPHGHLAYMARHFPQERPPVPAAPYVGGVEWEATNYLASHLDLLNAIIACTGPTAAERNALRADLRISGFERCLGGSLRTCKEKFYGAVHDGLRTWVAAAYEDGWDVRDVRYGPPPPETPRSRGASPAKKTPKKQAKAGGQQPAKSDDVPKLEIPKLDLGVDGPPVLSSIKGVSASLKKLGDDGGWLS